MRAIRRRYQNPVAIVAIGLLLSGCASSGTSVGVSYNYDPWGYDRWRYDYHYRSGIYRHHHEIDRDINVNRPDRPRTLPETGRGRGSGGPRGGGGGRRR